MIYINPNSHKIRKAKFRHREGLVELLYKRIDKINNNFVSDWFTYYVNDYLEELICGQVKDAFKISSRLNAEIANNILLKENAVKIFNYDWFIDKVEKRYCGYDLAKNLEINTCTYCNRNYTNTIITKRGEKITRPQFDHFFDKKRHPFLALSFYNLIPSCSICNSNIKHGIPFHLSTHAHPYLDKSIEEFKFTYDYSKDPYHKNGLRIGTVVEKDWFVYNLLNDLKIEEVYSSHTDLLFDLLKLKQAYSAKYLSILESEVLTGIKVSNSELYRLAFGVFYDEKDFDKRPFSKFKKDILKELNII
ncbi:hypothetical protein LCL86_14220 [Muricauda ruestringensis]|uniref:hypothetical protein n=1 Tax=Flagellimonas ruestringensis TaxID=111501 RepID=UPI001CD551F1|nr:hypothetical protein [Allomuricauda ruestringensis]MCA0960210.1 hypothetical protein [Allomuricauda ruestringensis]